ncbi:MAG: hypothetical protein RMJ98_18595 [Myxococcales bacterium]|nr:hypothetical protein [Polyangiaceae bacterium]MDW8251309.1 hypothetical protein [Myxococcales bacterium]
MQEENLFRKTMKLTTLLLMASVLWVGLVTLGSVLAVSRALPEQDGLTKPATPAPKPASSDGPSRSGPSKEDPPTRRRNG